MIEFDKRSRKRGIIHNCLKDLSFEWIKIVVMKEDKAIMKCKVCGAMFQETEWMEEDEE